MSLNAELGGTFDLEKMFPFSPYVHVETQWVLCLWTTTHALFYRGLRPLIFYLHFSRSSWIKTRPAVTYFSTQNGSLLNTCNSEQMHNQLFQQQTGHHMHPQSFNIAIQHNVTPCCSKVVNVAMWAPLHSPLVGLDADDTLCADAQSSSSLFDGEMALETTQTAIGYYCLAQQLYCTDICVSPSLENTVTVQEN